MHGGRKKRLKSRGIQKVRKGNSEKRESSYKRLTELKVNQNEQKKCHAKR